MSRFSSIDLSNAVTEVSDGLLRISSQYPSKGAKIVSWWVDCLPEPILIDCPEQIDRVLKNDLKKLSEGFKPRIILTNRNSHGDVSSLSGEFGWPVLLQEQEAYLLPELDNLHTFEEEMRLSSGIKLFWTPGPSPGSCVVYAPNPWNVLFCGRLLRPVANDQISSICTRMTFHWSTQQKSIRKLRKRITTDPLPSLACGITLSSIGSGKLLPWNAWEPVEIS